MKPLLFAAALVAGELLLLIGAAAFFRAMNADIPDNLLAGLLPPADEPILRAEALHAEAHDICYIANSVNFPVRHEAKVTCG